MTRHSRSSFEDELEIQIQFETTLLAPPALLSLISKPFNSNQLSSARIHVGPAPFIFNGLTYICQVDDWKYIAFHLSQTLALIGGKQVFTKADLVTQFPQLRSFLYREKDTNSPSELKPLDELLKRFLSEIGRVKFSKSGDLTLFYFGALVLPQLNKVLPLLSIRLTNLT